LQGNEASSTDTTRFHFFCLAQSWLEKIGSNFTKRVQVTNTEALNTMDLPHSSEKDLGLTTDDPKTLQTDLLAVEFEEKVAIDDPEQYASGTLEPTAAASSDELVSIDNDSEDGYVHTIRMHIQGFFRKITGFYLIRIVSVLSGICLNHHQISQSHQSKTCQSICSVPPLVHRL
jgi:hypothetical protein